MFDVVFSNQLKEASMPNPREPIPPRPNRRVHTVRVHTGPANVTDDDFGLKGISESTSERKCINCAWPEKDHSGGICPCSDQYITYFKADAMPDSKKTDLVQPGIPTKITRPQVSESERDSYLDIFEKMLALMEQHHKTYESLPASGPLLAELRGLAFAGKAVCENAGYYVEVDKEKKE